MIVFGALFDFEGKYPVAVLVDILFVLFIEVIVVSPIMIL